MGSHTDSLCRGVLLLTANTSPIYEKTFRQTTTCLGTECPALAPAVARHGRRLNPGAHRDSFIREKQEPSARKRRPLAGPCQSLRLPGRNRSRRAGYQHPAGVICHLGQPSRRQGFSLLQLPLRAECCLVSSSSAMSPWRIHTEVARRKRDLSPAPSDHPREGAFFQQQPRETTP